MVIAGSSRGGQEGHFATGPQGLRSLITGEFDISTAGSALKCILSHSKRGDRNIFSSLRSQGASIHSFAPRPRKALGGPGNKRTNGQLVDSSMLVIGYNNKATPANEQQQQQQNGSFILMIALISMQEAHLSK